jgi:hypothetical protein
MMSSAAISCIAVSPFAEKVIGEMLEFYGMLSLATVLTLIGLLGVIAGLARHKEALWPGLGCACPSALWAVISLAGLIVWAASGGTVEPRNPLVRYWWLCLPGLVIGGLAVWLGWRARSRSSDP